MLFDVRTVGLHFGNFLTFTAVSCVLRSTAFIALGTSAIDLAVCLAYAHKGVTAYGAYENDGLVATIVSKQIIMLIALFFVDFIFYSSFYDRYDQPK